ncbi:MAG: glycosyltransferase [Rhodobacteraceae bacterium]|nr:glycosyltransferase [Paracoccaceae bacterium]
MSGPVPGIAICTFRRESVHAAIASVAGEALPGLPPPVIILADNDDTPVAREAILAQAGAAAGRLVYVHRAGRNISVARNAALEAAERRGVTHLAFIDDDETALPGWLAALWARMAESGAGAVFGPVEAVYGGAAPRWMRAARPHDTFPAAGPDGSLQTGYCGNVLMNLAHPALRGLRFEPAFGRTGGEDTAFFAAAARRGAILAFAPAARVTEAVPPDRATLAWLVRRRFRAGRTHAAVMLTGPGASPRLRAAAAALGKAGACAAASLALAAVPRRRNAWLIRGALHAGAFSLLVGLPAADRPREGEAPAVRPGAAGIMEDAG